MNACMVVCLRARVCVCVYCKIKSESDEDVNYAEERDHA